MVSKELKQKAFNLRDAGHSYKFIEKELGIRRGTLSGWFQGRPFNPNQYTLDKIRNGPKVSAERRIQARIERTQKVWKKAKLELGDLSPRDLLMLGIGLYMGEGSKTGNIIRFANSDPAMVKIFIAWSKRIFHLTDNNFTLRVHSYPDINIREIEKYWLSVTHLPKSCLRRAMIDTRSKVKEKSGKLPYGTLHITVLAAGNSSHGVELFRLIQGYMKTIFEKI